MAKYDWEAIKQDYRTGRFSLGQLSERHGPDKAQISRQIRKHGWEQDLTDKVRQRTREKVTRATLPEEARESLDDHDDEAIVEHAADENAAVVKGHRKLLTHWRGLMSQYSDQLERQVSQGTITIQAKNGDAVSIDVPLDYVGKCLSQGAQALERVVKLERQSYGLDDQEDDDGLKPLSELMAEVASDDEA